jgi:dihydroxy-acid dehydratase
MVRISDGRMSGTAYGTVVLHVAPEAAAGGPLACLRSGDTIVLDVPARRLEVETADDFDTRPPAFETAYRPPERGYGALFEREVLQADEGCDFAFLVPPRR